VLATASGLPGLRSGPGADIPSGSAFFRARKLLGEQVMQRLLELDAAVADADLGIGLLWKGLEITAIDGTTMELARNGVLHGEFGTPRTAPGRCCGSRPTSAPPPSAGSAPRSAAATTARTPWPTSSRTASGPGMLNLAGRGFFSMDRFLRFSARGADLAWRVKNGAKSVPLKTV
jgi:hypothetical protein